jgi:uncharacterized protein
MTGEKNLATLLKTMQPELQKGNYVFCTVADLDHFLMADVLLMFREKEGITVIIEQTVADALRLPYDFVAAWITLTVHSSLAAVGLTAAFAQALAAHHISCNVVAAYYHDHIFVAQADAAQAMQVLCSLAAG